MQVNTQKRKENRAKETKKIVERANKCKVKKLDIK